MFELLNEPRIALTELAKREGVNTCTSWRWVTRGVAGVRLESFALGHRRYTTSPAFERWVERVTAAKSGQPMVGRTSRQREADQRRAKEKLLAAGLISELVATTPPCEQTKAPGCSGSDPNDRK